MEILAWNCRGLNNDRPVEALLTLIRQKKPAVIFLSETKVHDWDYMNNLRLQIGYWNGECFFSEGASGGVALFWADGLDIRFRSKSKFYVDVEVHATDGSGVRWRLIGFYGEPSVADRRQSWDLLLSLHHESSLPWLLVGDFNEIVSDSEKDGGVPRCGATMLRFQEALDEAELVDLGFDGAPFTWRGGGV